MAHTLIEMDPINLQGAVNQLNYGLILSTLWTVSWGQQTLCRLELATLLGLHYYWGIQNGNCIMSHLYIQQFRLCQRNNESLHGHAWEMQTLHKLPLVQNLHGVGLIHKQIKSYVF